MIRQYALKLITGVYGLDSIISIGFLQNISSIPRITIPNPAHAGIEAATRLMDMQAAQCKM
ncbi:MAG: hypothetical protein ACYTEX_25340 [Planctomycetota bacterium]